VEVIVRVTDPAHSRELRRLLDLGMDDGTASWWLDADGTWTRHNRGPGGEPLRDIQVTLMRDQHVRAADG
jgi:polyphosphate kinase